MADSGITKKALANALKVQMEEEPFSKITVGEICDRCDMNRKSFYYHFKDKFDLVEWIYSNEIENATQGKAYEDNWEFIKDVCVVLWDNRRFYRQAFRIKGQNSLCDSISKYFYPLIKKILEKRTDGEEWLEFSVEFISDSLVYSIKKWICGKDMLEPDEFISRLKKSIGSIAYMI